MQSSDAAVVADLKSSDTVVMVSKNKRETPNHMLMHTFGCRPEKYQKNVEKMRVLANTRHPDVYFRVSTGSRQRRIWRAVAGLVALQDPPPQPTELIAALNDYLRRMASAAGAATQNTATFAALASTLVVSSSVFTINFQNSRFCTVHLIVSLIRPN
ncbi:hypothetical protein BDZ89DRAFT_1033352 [Hymenopellis radicata]|nr:hypothetical protein BDZ89DRAFT_1033352 [Hymenopellis radicata]